MNKKIGTIALLAGLAANGALAGTLTSYQTGDVLVSFRKAGGSLDLVVDAGPVSTFLGFGMNTTNPITQFTGAQLAEVGSLNSMNWSAYTYLDNNTVFVTRGRTSLNIKSAAYPAGGSVAQGSAAAWMNKVVVGAAENIGFDGLNTATAIINEDNSISNPNYLSGFSYHNAGDSDNDGTVEFTLSGGSIEKSTTNTFTTGGVPVRADFYQVPPIGSGAVVRLGFFELSPSGILNYIANPIDAPQIVSIDRNQGTNTITFTTGTTGNYVLVSSPVIGTPVSTWTIVGTISGNAGIRSIIDVDSTGQKFYTVRGQ